MMADLRISPRRSLGTADADSALERISFDGGDIGLCNLTGHGGADRLFARSSVLRGTVAELGAVAIRGAALGDLDRFRAWFVSVFGAAGRYDFKSTERYELSNAVYSSTVYDRTQCIPLHQEMSYTRLSPRFVAFQCVQPAGTGGATTLCDGRAVAHRLAPEITDRFRTKGVCYHRTLDREFDMDWRGTLGVSTRQEAEARCDAIGVAYEWMGEDRLRIQEVCPGLRHGSADIWFNQAHLFHASRLGPEEQDHFRSSRGMDRRNWPRHATFADQSEIPDDLIAEIDATLQEMCLSWEWQAGDIVVLDNHRYLHGRMPFDGARSVAVTMSEPIQPEGLYLP